MTIKLLLVLLMPMMLTLLGGAARAATMGAADLRSEYRYNPLGIDVLKPRLSWILTADQRGARQGAYQILVASSPELLAQDRGDLWDSGRVESNATYQIEYAGKALESQARCHWKVRSWDAEGAATDWSEPAFWSMGLLNATDWQGHWIGYDKAYELSPQQQEDQAFNVQGLKWFEFPSKEAKLRVPTYLRKHFDLPADRNVRRAVLALYAFNTCAAELNGKPLGEAVHWDRTARLDATAVLTAQNNVLALTAYHSDPYAPAVIGRLVVQFETGQDLVIPVDSSWKTSQQFAEGWQNPGFDDSAWIAAEELDKTPWHGPPPVCDLPRVPAPFLRKEFAVGKSVRRAMVYVTALGTYELRLNGQRVGQDVLAPGWTEFRKRVHYQTYKVTDQIKTGENAIGAILGDGWYASDLAHLAKRNFYGGKPRFLAQLVIEFSDGSKQVVQTDGSWKASYGPILHADLLMGCEYDARREMPGWDRAGFDQSRWDAVIDKGDNVRKGEQAAKVQASVVEPSRPLEELKAKSVSEPAPDCWTFDLGQNMVGWVRLKVRGKAGQRITVRYAEMLNPDGVVYTASLRSCPATDFYILSGKGEETFEPYFTFHGFRYVEVRGLNEKPDLDAVTGIVVHTPMKRTGEFECSSALLNQLYSNIIWGQKGNYLEVPTDCPQRDERMGWTGDTQFFAQTASYNFDVAGFFTRWLQTCADDQLPDGSFPHVVPDIMGSGGATAWGDAALLCTYNIYHVYGDTRIVAEHFSAMQRYMHWLDGKTKEGISHVGGFGDWLNAGGGAAGPVIDTAYHTYLAGIMSEMAIAIGRQAEARQYAQLHDQVKAAFISNFLQPDGSLKDSSQTGYALAFSMGLLPEEMRQKSAEQFVEQIKKFDWHLATGFIGTPRLLPALHLAGRDDVAYRLLLTDTYPSWLFPVKNGATTMWERWNGWTPQGFGDISMNSYNHYAFGAVGEYLYATVGGIQAGTPGYKTIRIRPVPGKGISWARTRFESIHGLISTFWKLEGNQFSLALTLPANTTAIVYLPATGAITESGKPLGDARGVRFKQMENESAVLEVEGGGQYRFMSMVTPLPDAQ